MPLDGPTPPDQMFDPVQGMLAYELRRAGVTKRAERLRLLALEDIRFILDYGDELEADANLKAYLAERRYVFAARIHERLVNAYGIETAGDRVVGLLTGDQMEVSVNGKPEKVAGVLELTDVITDPIYTGAAEYFMIDSLKREMGQKGWTHLAIRTPLEQGDDGYLAGVAQRHGFVARDVKHGMLVRQWPPDDVGVEVTEQVLRTWDGRKVG